MNWSESKSQKFSGPVASWQKPGQMIPAHQLASRPDAFGQTLTRPSRSDPGWFCTIWSMPSLEKQNWNGCRKSDLAHTIWPNSGCTLAVTKTLPDWIQHVYWEYTCQVWCHVCLHITDIGAVYCTGDLPFHWPKELVNIVMQSHSDYRSTPVSVLRAPK